MKLLGIISEVQGGSGHTTWTNGHQIVKSNVFTLKKTHHDTGITVLTQNASVDAHLDEHDVREVAEVVLTISNAIFEELPCGNCFLRFFHTLVIEGECVSILLFVVSTFRRAHAGKFG
jgi:hypothetical protein